MQFDFRGVAHLPFRQLLIVGLFHSLCSDASGAIIVQPGATGSLEFPLTIDANSADDGGDAEISFDLPASLNGQLTIGAITIKESGQPQPVTIPKGQTRTFAINYSIGNNPPEGTHTATLKVFMSNVRIEGGLNSLDTSVNFTIRSGAFPYIQTSLGPNTSATNGIHLPLTMSAHAGAGSAGLLFVSNENFSIHKSFDIEGVLDYSHDPLSLPAGFAYKFEAADYEGLTGRTDIVTGANVHDRSRQFSFTQTIDESYAFISTRMASGFSAIETFGPHRTLANANVEAFSELTPEGETILSAAIANPNFQFNQSIGAGGSMSLEFIDQSVGTFVHLQKTCPFMGACTMEYDGPNQAEPLGGAIYTGSLRTRFTSAANTEPIHLGNIVDGETITPVVLAPGMVGLEGGFTFQAREPNAVTLANIDASDQSGTLGSGAVAPKALAWGLSLEGGDSTGGDYIPSIDYQSPAAGWDPIPGNVAFVFETPMPITGNIQLGFSYDANQFPQSTSFMVLRAAPGAPDMTGAAELPPVSATGGKVVVQTSELSGRYMLAVPKPNFHLASSQEVNDRPEIELDSDHPDASASYVDKTLTSVHNILNNVRRTQGDTLVSAGIYDLGPVGPQGPRPTRLTFRYDRQRLEALGVSEEALRVCHFRLD